MKGPDRKHRVLVFGLDGGTFDLLGPWLESGELSCLSRLYREGVHGPLTSTTPPLSPEAWATFMTGKNPGRHGVMNFLSFRPGTYELEFNSGAQVQELTLWEHLSQTGRRVGIVGVPMTYPPVAVNGYLIAGLESPSQKSQYTHPPELQAELRKAVGGYDLHGEFLDTRDPEAYLQRLLRMVENQARAVSYLLASRDIDLSVFVMTATDRVQHYFWRLFDPEHPAHDPRLAAKLGDSLKEIFRSVDAAMASLIDQVPEPKTIFVMSDHGFGPCRKVVRLNAWLQQQGYLAARPRAVGGGLRRKAWSAVSGRLPRGLKDWLKSALPGVRRRVESSLLLSHVDWRQTRAFSLNLQYGYLYVNRRERFPEGVVAPGRETDALCDDLSAKLRDLRDPETGEPVVREVHRVRDISPGPALDHLPDLVVIWSDGYAARTDTKTPVGMESTGPIIERRPAPASAGQFIPGEWSGCHRQQGILLGLGPALRTRATVDGARLVDLAPTILHCLGEAVPEDMEGQVLRSIFRPDFLSAHPVRLRPPLPRPKRDKGRPETDEMEQRLRDLGYLD